MAVQPDAAGRVPTPGGVPVTEAAAMATGCSGRTVADTAAEMVGKSGPDGAVARDTQLVPIHEAAICGAGSDASEDVLQGSLIAVAKARRGRLLPFPGPLPRLQWGQWMRARARIVQVRRVMKSTKVVAQGVSVGSKPQRIARTGSVPRRSAHWVGLEIPREVASIQTRNMAARSRGGRPIPE